MIGETLLRDLGVLTVEQEPADWVKTGETSEGEQVWECRFDGKSPSEFTVATVVVHPLHGLRRTLYATMVADDDRIPRVPISVRRSTEAFARRLEGRG